MAGIKDFATGIVVTAPSPATSGTTLTLQVGEGARMPAVPFFATAHPATEMPTLDNAEKVSVTDVTGNVLTIVRAQGDTTAKSIVAGWRVSNALFAADIARALADLTDDATHRLVSDTEKSTWNAKQAAMGADDNYVTDAEKAALHPQVTGGTPALTLGTANTAGNAATFIRTNDTILAFDATALTAEAIASTSSVGTATVAARRDHRHAMPTALAFLSGVGGGYAACATAIGTAAKTVALTGYTLVVGGTVGVTFTNGNSATTPTLNINSAGAKPIFANGVAATTIPAGYECVLLYDGTNYAIVNSGLGATAPTTQAFGDTAVAGTALESAHVDHKHAMPAAPTTITGNAGTATALATPRAINGVNFDGSAAITIPDVIVTAAPASDHVATGMKIVLAAHENQAFGDVCYIASDGQAQLIDADAIATMSAVVMCIDATIAANASGNYLMMGIARDDTWNWTVGGIIYGTVTGTTANTLSQTAPTGTDDVVQIMGVATHADRMLFNPQLVQVERT